MNEPKKDDLGINGEPVVGNLKDYQDLAKSMNQQQPCPQCGYCPCCGRPRGNWNYPIYPTTPYPYWQTWCGGTSNHPSFANVPHNTI